MISDFKYIENLYDAYLYDRGWLNGVFGEIMNGNITSLNEVIRGAITDIITQGLHDNDYRDVLMNDKKVLKMIKKYKINMV